MRVEKTVVMGEEMVIVRWMGILGWERRRVGLVDEY